MTQRREGEPGDEMEGLQYEVRSAVPASCLQRVANIATGSRHERFSDTGARTTDPVLAVAKFAGQQKKPSP